MADDSIDMILHDFEFIFLSVADDLIDNVFHGLNEILEGHLVGVSLVPHDFDEDEVVVIFGDFGTSHTWEIG